ncbi:hypothetical protein EJ08DRAFT_305423 [Tothia fuscella]|uniref:Ankyrin repeat protein n=1 Tax=Tothia fuscella TaxID=1048955 RepID=A0A9P4TXP5_9PEZI|nr:hypothetical protein EJ08DRAFT_305423 [Tothia fuscella]
MSTPRSGPNDNGSESVATLWTRFAQVHQDLLDDTVERLKTDLLTASTVNLADFMKSQEDIHPYPRVSMIFKYYDKLTEMKHNALEKLLGEMHVILPSELIFQKKLGEEDSRGLPPICVAIERNRLDDVELLLSQGAPYDVEALDNLSLKNLGWRHALHKVQLAIEFYEIQRRCPEDIPNDFNEFNGPNSWESKAWVRIVHYHNTNGPVVWALFRQMQQHLSLHFHRNAFVDFFLQSFQRSAVTPGNELLDYRDPGYITSMLQMRETDEEIECASVVVRSILILRDSLTTRSFRTSLFTGKQPGRV